MRNCLILLFLVNISCENISRENSIEKEYYPDGKVEAIYQYDSEVKDLVCGTRYYRSGKPKKKYCLLNDKFEGEYLEYFENGKLMKSFYLKGGQYEGLGINYYENGNIKDSVNYINGKREGFLSIRRENGSLKAKNYFVDDFVHYVEIFDENEQSNGIKNFIPKISLQKDTIYSGDTLVVDIEMALPKDQFILKDFYVNIEFCTIEECQEELLDFPRNIYSFDGKAVEKSFLFKDTGDFILYGFLSNGKGFDDAHKYEMFKLPFVVLN